MGDDFVRFFESGGVFMWPLAFCSVVALTIILERGFALRRGKVISSRVAGMIDAYALRAQLPKLAEAATADSSSLARLVVTILNHLGGLRSESADAVQIQARHEIMQLERGLVILEIITGVAPLLGLLGTVSGLVHIFGTLGTEGFGSQGIEIARGISEALHTTVAGLVIAIPALVFWSYFTKKIEVFAAEMESLCGELLTKVYQPPV